MSDTDPMHKRDFLQRLAGRKRGIFFLLLLLLFLAPLCSYAAETAAPSSKRIPLCWSEFARIGGLIFYHGPKRLAIAGFNKGVNSFRDAYIAAYKSGETRTQGWKNVAIRLFISPRVHEKDPVKRAEELKHFLWGDAAKVPIGTALEIYSKGLVLTGRAPLEKNISIPADIALGIAGGYVTEWRLKRGAQRTQHWVDESTQKGSVGLEYAQEWSEATGMELKDAVAISNKYNSYLRDWISDIQAKKKERRLPPRLYQFQMLHLLNSEQEVSELERIMYQSLGAYNELPADKKAEKGEENLKSDILRRLKESKIFQSRDPKTLALLAKAFDPPFFFNGNGWVDGIRGADMNDMSWVEEIRASPAAGIKAYERKLDAFSDLRWLLSTGEKPSLAGVESAFGPELSAAKARFAYEQSTADSQKAINAKKEIFSHIRDFPENKKYLATRTDFPLYSAPSVAWVDKSGKPISVEKESDYWALLSEHPAFRKIKADWANGTVNDADTIAAMKRRMYDLNELYGTQEDSIPAGKKLPTDPTPGDACNLMSKKTTGLMSESNSLRGEVDQWKKDIGPVPENFDDFCTYRVFVGVWRVYASEQAVWRDPRAENKYDGKENDLKAKIKALCSDEAVLNKSQSQLGFHSREELNNALSCHDEK